MKKLYILFFTLFTSAFFGQTYSITLRYRANGAGCHAAGYDWSFYGNTTSLASFSDGGNSMDIPTTYTTYASVANYSSFKLYLHNSCVPLGAATKDCNDNNNSELTNINLIKGGYLGLNGCNGGVSVDKFIPNVNIKNLDVANPAEVCAGFQLGLAAFPDGFPAEAYHWQYSSDNMITWVDVPATINGVTTNDIKTVNFSMQDILGVNHANFIDKQIYFRLGYTQTRAFSAPIAIKYSSCAPVVKQVVYIAPKCNGDNVQQIDVYFDRKLKPNEDLFPIYLKNEDPTKTTPLFEVSSPVSSLNFDAATNWYTYSFINPGVLENNNSYTIKYQARLSGAPAGSLQSSQTPFVYIDPPKMQFKITGQTQPTCFGGEDGTIDIEILSGTSPYNFYVDNVLTIASKIDNLHYKITSLKANALGYKIKVTDTNECIEK